MAAQPILLVEDNPDDEELILLALGDHVPVNRIVVARDGVEALEYLFATGRYAGRDQTELPAVVLLDLKLPKLSGLDVLRRLRADPRTGFIPVVVLTSSDEERDIVSSYQLGTNGFVSKPVDFHEFQKAVGQIVRHWVSGDQPAKRK